ncbi:MAG TPA: phospho-N-acetylmuramoyl-pentapeptide-transferase [Bacillota bacterium]|nr:phospho-N-acetylmuramoyl-pentapeptide-transferase [Bacillota bacterium]HPT88326.1 phospho-N-acetylmuramoyl-pentapeptide-transferase [Bacillota bacterium]
MAEVTQFMTTLFLSLLRYIIILFICYGITAFIFPYLLRMMQESNLQKPNFREELIPSEAGMIFVVLLPLTIGIGMFLKVKSFTTLNAILFLFVVIGMGFLGLLDDLIGTNEHKGFRGHFKALLKEKRLTSGGFKAIFGAVIAMVFSLATASLMNAHWNLWVILINFILVVLSANTINLFDLRPGRAGKVFLVGFILILAFSKDFENYMGLFLPLLAIVLYYLPFDLKAKVMMGDVGSNILGATLGVMMAWMLTDFSKIIAATLLIILQLLAEKYSFTKIIEKYRWLKKFDNWGRGEN